MSAGGPASDRSGILGPVALLVAGAVAAQAAAEGRPLPAASDGTHAWLAVERARPGGTEHVLLHHAAPMGCDCVHETFTLPRAPEAIAAEDGSVWVVMPPESPGGRRDVFSATVRRNPATGAYFVDPPGRMRIHPSLPAEGAIAWIQATGGSLRVRRCGSSPEELMASGWAESAGSGSDGGGDPFREAIPGAPAPAVSVRLPDGRREIRYALPAGEVPLSAFEVPGRACALLGVGGRFGLFVPTGEGGAAVRWIDAVDGTSSPLAVLGPQPASAIGVVCAPLLAVGAGGVLAVIAAWRIARLKSGSGERR